MNDLARRRVDLLGVPVDAVTMAEALHWALEQLPTGETNLIFTPNPEIVYRAWHDPVFYQALTSADLLVPDGIGVVWAAARLGQPVPERVPGYDLMIHLLAALARRHGRVFFLGARPEVVQAAAQVASRRWPGLVVTGYHHGYFQPGQEEQAVLQKIRAAAPDLLLVALGAGKQEEWLAFHRAELQVPLAIAVGGSFDVLAGITQRAPTWMQRLHLEWLYRLLRQPSRWRRMLALPRFAWTIIKAGAKR
ncbi:MAG TPA: WecB/TagA/CpsF family glycosyltransferase [Firmicutes bacterium]|jgi:N-acetylglucosaminyldiphosphoundecaprenol N-acetyl-beta-D-mannosaminyltransferase|nr:WecB/TagA/CpsF family glycosyltransferase [Bacillota bacterium]